MDSPFLPQYAAQAVIDLERTTKEIRKALKEGMPNMTFIRTSINAMDSLAGLLRHAVHVVLPPNGEVYRDNQFGGAVPTPDEVESFQGLPAPVTCFEYPWTHPKQPTDDTLGTKRITVVIDNKQLYENTAPPPGLESTVQVFSIYYHEQFGDWVMYPGVVTLAQPLEVFKGDAPGAPAGISSASWGMRASYRDLETGEFADPNALTPQEAKRIGEFRADITAVIQCCHSLRAGASFDEKKETSSSRRWRFDKRGVGGFTYHVLKIPTHTRETGREGTAGGHSSPRFHIRRHHIRKLPTGALTFVRQCFVGDKERGAVQKNYEVKR
jgi:hypothetical protein